MDGTGGGRTATRAEADAQADKDRLIAELHEAVRARDEFVAIAAHELRNPMTPILLQVSGLAAMVRDPARCRSDVLAPRIELLERAVEEFVRRSTALLDVSRIAAGNVPLDTVETDLTAVVSSVMDRARLAARAVGTLLEPDLQDGVVGLCDPLALEQVTENLISNAVKFGAHKPVAIRLVSDGRIARLTVRDRGIGISEPDRARIFGRFERAVARRDHGGFGVGLWLVNQLVTAMGGGIEIETAPGEGTTFIVTLPLDAKQEGSPAYE
jgi:signal transduction histidine kinase